MNEKPILFSGSMVRAIQEGRKTQTRRVVKLEGFSGDPAYETADGEIRDVLSLCPYGKPGSKLWVKETWAAYTTAHPESGEDDEIDCRARDIPELYGRVPVVYRADGNSFPEKWRPSIFMPRWASRITLEILSVRVERLQDISEEDAKAEGIERYMPSEESGLRGKVWWKNYHGTDLAWSTAARSYQSLWESINGKREGGKKIHNKENAEKVKDFSWDANPWVWVIEFKKL